MEKEYSVQNFVGGGKVGNAITFLPCGFGNRAGSPQFHAKETTKHFPAPFFAGREFPRENVCLKNSCNTFDQNLANLIPNVNTHLPIANVRER